MCMQCSVRCRRLRHCSCATCYWVRLQAVQQLSAGVEQCPSCLMPDASQLLHLQMTRRQLG